MDIERNFPVSDFMKDRIVGGITIYKSTRSWMALLLTRDGRIRLYKWVKRGDTWKVDLARFDITEVLNKIVEAANTLRELELK